MIRSSKILKAARGEQCTLQIVGVCNGNPETVVFCHFPDESHGMGLKADDICGGFGCSACHDMIDGRSSLAWADAGEKHWYMRRSQTRTLRKLFESGVLKIA